MTTTTITPNSSNTDFGGTVTPVGGSVAAVLADASDSTYVDLQGTGFNSTQITLGMSTFTLPAGAVITAISNSWRGDQYAFVFVYAPASANPPGVQLPGPGAVTYTNNATDAGGVQPSTQSDIDNYQLRILNNSAGNPGAISRIFAASTTFTYVLVPSTAVSGPTGVLTNTSVPTVTWAHTPGNGAQTGQTKYQLRVFTAAQYGIGGFDPTSSPAAYDSGVIASAATSANTGSLANSTTYRAYVRTAQTTNGIDQWATPAFSGFSLNLTTPELTSVVASAQNATARNQIIVTRNGTTPLWTSVEVQRSIDGGATWAYVRGYTRFAPPSSPFTLFDYEVPNTTAATYRARATYQVTGLDVSGSWVSSSTVTWTSATDYWLKDPRIPARNLIPRVRNDTTFTRARPQGRFDVIGRVDPVVVSDVRHLTAGTLVLYTLTDAEATALLLLTTTDVLLIQTPTTDRTGSRYLAIGDLVEERIIADRPNSQLRGWSMDYVEITAPADTGIS